MSDNLQRRTVLKFAGFITLAALSPTSATILAHPARPRGYGADPNLLTRDVSWDLTLGSSQLASLEALCGIVLPAEPPYPSADTLKTHEFLNEWLSAPYPRMQADRTLVLDGLTELQEIARAEYHTTFLDANLDQQTRCFELACSRIDTMAFARRLIELICAGYYTTREGHAAIGYVGNVALERFPEPPADLVRHFERALG